MGTCVNVMFGRAASTFVHFVALPYRVIASQGRP